MIDYLTYYFELAIALCGFDGSDDYVLFGWFAVSLAGLVVVYAFYEGVCRTLWPGETDPSHIKYQILDETEVDFPGAN
ncbi:MAG: hypothetical protein R3E82_02700 [Pseudomonadales bacterium]|nr:hypothetical protein [Pseudomonadales bacterium]